MRRTGQTHCACSKRLRRDNRSGVCNQKPCQRAYHEPRATAKRQRGRDRCVSCPALMRRDCEHQQCLACRNREQADRVALAPCCELCGVKLDSCNRSGRCLAHRLKAAAVCGCGRSVQKGNVRCLSCCKADAHATRRARATKHCDCGEPLRADNESGMCKRCYGRAYTAYHREMRAA